MFWRKKANGADLTIFFASDLHGSTVCFKKFVNAAGFYGASLLVLGGDLTGKAVLPVAKQTDGSYLAMHSGREIRLTTEQEVRSFLEEVANKGFYGTVLSEEEFRHIKDDEAQRDRLFRRLVVERVIEWADIAREKLKDTDTTIVTAPGNDDFEEIDNALRESGSIEFREMEISEYRGYEILHCGGSTPTPWDTEREYSEAEYRARFDQLLPKVKDMSRCIFNVHVPPKGTTLDECPKLDNDLKVVFEMGNPAKMHGGSDCVREVIESEQPLVGLHGHIHEGRGSINLGRTVCVNPGSAYPEGILQGTLLKISGGTVESVQMLQG